MAPKRQQIMDAIATRMAGILTTATPPYYFDLGLNVIESRPQLVSADGSVGRVPVEPAECPCVMVRDPMDTVTRMDLRGNEKHILNIEIEIRNEGGAITDSDLRKMEQDVRTAIGLDQTWGGLAKDTIMNTSEKLLLQAERIIGGLLIKATVTFYTSAWSET